MRGWGEVVYYWPMGKVVGFDCHYLLLGNIGYCILHHGNLLCLLRDEICKQNVINLFFSRLFRSSKTALLEGLEVDQYMWGILNAIQK